MARVALLRLRRFGRLAAAAEASGSAFWRTMARRAAAAALRDCLLHGLPTPDEPAGRPPEGRTLGWRGPAATGLHAEPSAN